MEVGLYENKDNKITKLGTGVATKTSEETKICDSCLALVVAKLRVASEKYKSDAIRKVDEELTLLEIAKRHGNSEKAGWLWRVADILETDDLMYGLNQQKKSRKD